MQKRKTSDVPEKQFLLDAITVHDSWRLFKILAELVDGFEALSDIYPAVSIFGSARVRPGDEPYERTVIIARKLAENGFNVITGGGPGSMEAANLGASFTGTPEQLDAASDELAAVPSFKPSVEAWAKVAFGVRDRYRCTAPTLGIPTWFYGHEPPNLFASHIAKYFDNALREDVLLSLCRGGIVYLRGAAGTVQEIFQAATRNYYAGDAADLRPLVLVGVDHWTRVVPAWPLLAALGRDRLMAGHLYLVEDVDEALAVLS